MPARSESSIRPAPVPPQYARAVLLAVAAPSELERYAAQPFLRIAAHTTTDALRHLVQSRPQVVALDWDVDGVDGPGLCRAAARTATVLVTTAQPETAPSALRAGCHSILLKPFAPTLLAGRLGRLLRDAAARSSGAGTMPAIGTNRQWANEVCARCGTPGPTSFEYSSRRRAWYACLSCDGVWLGPRRE